MALAFESDRVTSDVDFSSIEEPSDLMEKFTTELNNILPKTAINLGYPDLLCRVQSMKQKPRCQNFEAHKFPALQFRIGSAKRGTNEEVRLKEGKATRVLVVNISFRDQVYTFQKLNLNRAGVTVCAFTIHELIAEKIRALIQQLIRNRNRQQDVHDIAFLIDKRNLSDTGKATILTTLIKKCYTHGIEVNRESMDDPEIKQRAKNEWETLSLEISNLPSFEGRFALMHDLYISLPWNDIEKDR